MIFENKVNAAKIKLYSVLYIFLFLSLLFRNGMSFIFSIFFITIALLLILAPNEDRRFLVIVLSLAFLVRIALAYILHLQSCQDGFQGFISGDDRLYTIRALKMAMMRQHLSYNSLCDLGGDEYGVNPFTYLLSLFYTFFKPAYFSSKLLNCFIGSVTPLFVYFLGKKMFSLNAARISAILVSFYPSMVRWSLGNLKDPLTIFLISLALYLILNVDKRALRFIRLLAIFVCILLLKQLQVGVFFAFAASIMLFIVYKFLKRFSAKKITIPLILSIIIFTVIVYMAAKPMLLKFVNSAITRAMGLYTFDNAGYFIYNTKMLKEVGSGILSISSLGYAYLKGFCYFLFTPFPWSISNLNQLSAYPQVIAWYFLLSFSVFGFLEGLRSSKDKTIFVILFLVLGISLFSFAEGNIGSAFRHRDNFSPLIFIYSAAGMVKLFTNKRYL